jgi:hypothetical protein
MKLHFEAGVLSVKDFLSSHAFFRKKFVVHETQPEIHVPPTVSFDCPLFVRGFDSARRLFAG